MEYSEVLEFFPGTSPWKEACIRLSDLYLKTRREAQSRLVLARLRLKTQDPSKELEIEVLTAYAQNFIHREAFLEMKEWLAQRSAGETRLLRASPELMSLWGRLLERSDLEPETQLELWSLLGHQRPIKALMELGRERDWPFPKKLLAYLLNKSMDQRDEEAIRSIINLMVQNGWGKVVHEQFKTRGEGAENWKLLWLYAMGTGRLYEEVLEVLDTMDDSQDRVIERMDALIGLRRFEEGLILLVANGSWLKNALPLSKFELLLEGILSLPQGNLYRDQFFEALGAGGMRDLLWSRWILKGKEREDRLRVIALGDEVFGSMAADDLSSILAEEGRLEDLIAWEKIVAGRFPGTKILEQIQKRIETLSTLRGEVSGDQGR